MLGYLLVYSILACKQPDGKTVSVGYVEQVLADCPSAASLGALGADPSARPGLESVVELAMRRLQQVPTSTLKTVALDLYRRCNEGTAEFKAYKRKWLGVARAKFPMDPPSVLDRRIAGMAFGPLTRLIWVDRYLFKAPFGEKSDKVFFVFSRIASGEVDRLYPLSLLNGAPHFAKKIKAPSPVDFPPGADEYLHEFEYYAGHYKRRPKWW